MVEASIRKPYINAATFALALVVVLLTAWAYGPALDAPFVLDDGRNIIDSPAVHWTEFSLENVGDVLDSSLLRSRPVANLSFALDHLRVGLEPRGFHITNIFIHLTVGVLIWWLCCVFARVTTNPGKHTESSWAIAIIALVPVALFLVHPLNTQAVTYVVQRMSSLAALFTIVAFASYLTARYKLTSSSGRWYLIAIISWLLGLCSKENAVLLIPVVLLYEACFFRNDWRAKAEITLGRSWTPVLTLAAVIGSLLLVAIIGILAVNVSDSFGLLTDFPGREFNGVERMLTQCRVQLFHLSQLIWPVPGRLNLDHDFIVSRGLLDPGTTLSAVMACVAVIGSIVVLAVRHPRYGFPLASYVIFHSLEAGPVSLEMVFEHRMYLPGAMLAPLVTVTLADSRFRYRLTATVLLVVFILVLAGWANTRNQTWSEPLGIHRDMALKSPNKGRAQYAYALALIDAERADEALPVIQRAVQLDPNENRVRRLLGEALMDVGRPGDAVAAYRAAVDLAPADVRSVLGLGRALDANGEREAAFRYYLTEGIRFGRGGRPWEAIPVLSAAIDLRDDDAGARNALGGAYMGAGLGDKAIEQFRAALELDSALFEAWFNLGVAAEALGYRDEAIRAYQGFLEQVPNSLEQPIMRARERIRTLSSIDD